jgi:hypothetical protein
MTEVEGSLKQLGQGKTQKTYNYEPLGSLVDIVFNSAGKFPAAASADSPPNKPPHRPGPPGDYAEGQGQEQRRRRRFVVCLGVVDAHACFAARQHCCEHVHGIGESSYLVVIAKYNLCRCHVLSREYNQWAELIRNQKQLCRDRDLDATWWGRGVIRRVVHSSRIPDEDHVAHVYR